MPRIVRFVPDVRRDVTPQAVYWRERWDEEWVYVPDLWCQQAVWNCAPATSTAQLRYRYGDSLRPFWQQFAIQFRERNRLRRYVKVEFVTLPTDEEDFTAVTRYWYGFIDIELDELDAPFFRLTEDGERVVYATGKNHFTCFGLEALLDQGWVDRSFLWDDPNEVEVGRGLTFNIDVAHQHGHLGNRSSALGSKGTYLFHNEKTGGALWTTKQIADYLLAYCTPRDHNDDQVLKFKLKDDDSALPDWDGPLLKPAGRTTREALNSLIARQRLLSWRIEVELTEDGIGGEIYVRPFTFSTEDFDVEQGQTIRANPDQIILAFERDRSAVASLKRTSSDQADVVIVIGALRTSMATFSFFEETLAIGWPLPLEVLFEQAASTAPEYPPASEVNARMTANEYARKADKFAPVYARFVWSDTRGLYVGTGTGSLADQVLTPSDENPDDPVPIAPEDHRFLPELPLLAGYDYSGTKIEDDDPTEHGPTPHKHLQPIVLFPRSGDVYLETWRKAESAGIVGDHEFANADEADLWSAHCHVDHTDGALWVTVTNCPQEWIARTDHTRLGDDMEALADFRQMLVTAAVPWSKHVEERYPEEAPFGRDHVRIMQIDAGDDYRLDYVVPGTVVALDPGTGELIRSESGGFVRDDRGELRKIARLAYAWYGEVRRALSFQTTHINNQLEVGDLIVSIGDPEFEGDTHVDDVNSAITQVRISCPLAVGEGPLQVAAPTIHYETAFGELDPLKLL